MGKLSIACILLIICFTTIFQSSNADYDVTSFGAEPDGITDSTEPFLTAWTSACNSNSTATVYVPPGRFLISSIIFNGTCNVSSIEFRIDGTIVAPPSYSSLGNTGFWILFYKVNNLSIFGGTVDARGADYWACREAGKDCPPHTRSVSFRSASNVTVTGMTSIDSRTFHISINKCNNITLQELNISAPSWSPNTDGIHIQSSTGITIVNSTIATGDDCISIGPGSKNLSIRRIRCGPGHGISIGSLGGYTEDDVVEGVNVTDSEFTETKNGLRIKTFPTPNNGSVRNIEFRNFAMTNVSNPIIIDQNYCPHNQCHHGQGSGVRIDSVRYKNITGTSASHVAVKFNCSPSKPCTGIILEDIELTYYKNSSTLYSIACCLGFNFLYN